MVFAVGKVSFHWSGNSPVDPGFTVLQSWGVPDEENRTRYEFVTGQKWDIIKVGVSVGGV